MSQSKPTFFESLRSFLLIFCIFYLTFWVLFGWFGDDPVDSDQAEQSPQYIKLVDTTIALANLAEFQIHNRGAEAFTFAPCSDTQTLSIYGLVNGERTANLLNLDCEAWSGSESVVIPSGKYHSFDLSEFSMVNFAEPGKYLLGLQITDDKTSVREIISPEFEYFEPGFFRSIFRALVIKPLFNALVFFVQILPSHSMGVGIIMLTLLVRVMLFLPTQKAMKSQRAMQKLQPKIEELKAKYKDQQQVMAMKMMELYRTNQVSPMSALTPMLLQFPFLIGTYFIVLEGMAPHKEALLWPFLNFADLSLVDNQFLSMDLTSGLLSHLGSLNAQIIPYILLPIGVGLAQYVAMKLAMPTPSENTVKPDSNSFAGQMQNMQKMMVYVLPVMLGVFTAIFPAGVGIYWLTSTLFGIGQQRLVNFLLDREAQVVRRDPTA